MLVSDESGDRASVGERSTCVGTECTAVAADQTDELGHHNKGISHAWSSCMRISSNCILLPQEKSAFCMLSVNRISLPIPNL